MTTPQDIESKPKVILPCKDGRTNRDGWADIGIGSWLCIAGVTSFYAWNDDSKDESLRNAAYISLILLAAMVFYIDTATSKCNNGVMPAPKTPSLYKLIATTGVLIIAGYVFTKITKDK